MKALVSEFEFEITESNCMSMDNIYDEIVKYFITDKYHLFISFYFSYTTMPN